MPEQFRVKGTSMQPALLEGSVVMLQDGPLSRNAIVAFRFADSIDVKRIIGLPGESIEISGDRVLANGQEVARAWPKDRRHWALGPDELFVLGDNAENSRDSRDYGPVPAEGVIGVVIPLA